MNIAGMSIRRPVFIVMIVASLITLGLIGYFGIPVDLLPNVQQPTIFVFTSYPGASAEEIETVITKPLENALGTVEGLDTLSSNSREGSSIIVVTFVIGVNIDFSELKVRELVDSVLPQLPANVNAPTVRRFSTDDIPIMTLSITGDKSLPDLGDVVTYTIQPRLQSLQGVGSIQIFGARQHIIDVSLNAALLKANGLTYQQVIGAINARNVTLPVGTVYGTERNVDVRVLGQAKSVEDFANMKLTSSAGRILRIKDVAKVSFGLADELVRARYNDRPAVLFQVLKQSGSNTVAVADNIRNAIPVINADLPTGTKIEIVNDTSDYIRRSVRGVQQDILFGAFLAIVIVWLFLGNFRSTIITAAVLPNCLLGAFFLAYIAGFSLNTLTLLALSLSVGLLIDDSIVVRENIFRYIEEGADPKAAAEQGTNEVALPVVSTTAAILAVFIPISFMRGTIGQFFQQFGLMVVFALCISLLDAFTTAPMLSAYWYRKREEGKRRRGLSRFFAFLSAKWNVFYEALKRTYRALLSRALDHKAVVLVSVFVLFGVTIFVSRFVGSNFLSQGDAGSYSINFQVAPGQPLETVDRYVREVSAFLKTKPYIDNYYAVSGRFSANQGEIDVALKPLSQRSVSTDQAIAQTRAFIRSRFESELIYRLSPGSSLPGLPGTGGFGGGAISLNIIGTDLDRLQSLTNTVVTIMRRTPGVSDLNTSMQPGPPELVIEPDDVKAQAVGVTAAALAQELRDLIAGNTLASSFTVSDQSYGIVVRLNPQARSRVSDIENLLITTPAGKVPLSAIARSSFREAPLVIQHEDRNRVARLNGNLEPGYSLGEVIGRLKDSIDREVVFPEGYRWEFAGQQLLLSQLLGQILFAVGLAVLFIYMILASLYNSFIQPFFIMLSIILAVIGVFLALLFLGVDLDIYGYIGLLLVLGLVAKNAILLVDFTNRRRAQGMSVREAILAAGPIRLRPILMTSFAMIFGMLPLALGLDEGSNGRQALPIAVIGGILTSTFLTLVVVPVVYELFERWLEKRRARKAAKTP